MDIEKTFDELGPRLYAYLRRLGLDREDAQDGISEIFLRAMNSRIDWEKPSSYLYKIGYHYAIDLQRKPKTDSIDHYIPISTDAYEDDFLSPLSTEERSIILMLYQEKLTYEEISEITNKPIGTLKSIVFRAKEKIRKEEI
jgi:RNA polymerase sigma-70 factor (ECF subfamily)